MRPILTLLSTVAIFAAIGTAQAQNAGAVVPQVVAPQAVGSTVQGTSDAATKATQGTPADKAADKKDDHAGEKAKTVPDPKK